MDLNATRMFVVAVQAGSLSAAANRLGIPLPTLSRRIRELEGQLRVQLLQRRSRGVTLTDAGAKLYELASHGIAALLEAEQAVVHDQTALKGRLRLTLPQGFEPWWGLLGAFQRRYPEIQVHVFSTDRRLDLVEEGIDVALRVGKILHEAMVARRILSFRNILVASPELVRRYGMPEEPVALDRFPCAVWAAHADVQTEWNLGGKIIGPNAVFSTNDYQHLCNRVLAGDVVAELPPFMAATPIREKRLVPLLPLYPLPEWPLTLLYPAHRHPSTIVRAYLDFCQKYISNIAQACEIEA
jgi:DNA-binding transcriptional LysR family regulator